MKKLDWIRMQRYNYTFPYQGAVKGDIMIGREYGFIRTYSIATPLRAARAARLFAAFSARALASFYAPESGDRFVVGLSVGV